MNIQKLAASFVIAVSTLLGTGIAHATCTTSGTVVTVLVTATKTTAYVLPASVNLPLNYYFVFTTTNTNQMAQLQGSLRKQVTINGDASSCPTTGTYRSGGGLTNFYVR